MDDTPTLVAYKFTGIKDIYLGIQQGNKTTFYGIFFDKKSANEFMDILESTVQKGSRDNA